MALQVKKSYCFTLFHVIFFGERYPLMQHEPCTTFPESFGNSLVYDLKARTVQEANNKR